MKLLLIFTLVLYSLPSLAISHPANSSGVLNQAVLNVKHYGVTGAGTNDETKLIQLVLDLAASQNKSVYFPKGVYLVSSVRIKNGIQEIYGDDDKTVIRAIYKKGEALLELNGHFFGKDPVRNFCIRNITFDCNSLARRAIFVGSGSSHGIMSHINIYGLNNPAIAETGIYLHFGASYNTVKNCVILLGEHPTSLVGVHLVGETRDIYASWGSASDQSAITPTTNNVVEGNTIIGGTHAIALHGADNNTIVSNTIKNASQRGIILSPLSSNNKLVSNKIYNFGSSGIHLAYNSSNNLIKENYLYAPNSSGEGGIQAYVGCSTNIIEDNYVECASNFGIYLAVDVQGNRVVGNTIKGNVKKAMLSIESNWRSRNLVNKLSKYSRPNYSSPPNGAPVWAYKSSNANVIQENKIFNDNTSVANIAIIEVGKNKIQSTTISNNYINNKKLGTVKKEVVD